MFILFKIFLLNILFNYLFYNNFLTFLLTVKDLIFILKQYNKNEKYKNIV